MHIEVSRSESVIFLNVSGRMDATTVGEFTAEWQKHAEDADAFLIDLEGLEYISSAGLRGILTIAKSCRSCGKKLVFCSLQTMVADIFKISGFSSILPVYATKAEALSSLG